MRLKFVVEAEPHEAKEIEVYQDAVKWRSVVQEMAQWLRKKTKYTEEPLPGIEEAKEQLFEILKDEGLDLWD